MAPPPPPRLHESPPALPDELVEEILLRLPPDEPACLLRASLVCKSWGSDVSRPGFRRRLQELHRAPPLLGFLHNQALPPASRFIPTTASSFSLAAPDRASWRALDCRHGRTLFLSEGRTEVLLWEPITGGQQRVPLPEGLQPGLFAGAVVCAVDTVTGIFTVELQSEKARKVCDKRVFCNVIPVVSFYTPVHRGERQDPLSSGHSEEAGGGEDGGEKEKAIEQPQQLFDKGSNAIEEGDFVNAYFSHALNIRVPSHGEVALKCASTEYGCALLLKAQVINDPLDNVPQSASNEESVTGTTSKYADGNSKTFCSNVEDPTPSRKVLR